DDGYPLSDHEPPKDVLEITGRLTPLLLKIPGSSSACRNYQHAALERTPSGHFPQSLLGENPELWRMHLLGRGDVGPAELAQVVPFAVVHGRGLAFVAVLETAQMKQSVDDV